MSGYKSFLLEPVMKLITLRHPITEVYRHFLCNARCFLLQRHNDISLSFGRCILHRGR